MNLISLAKILTVTNVQREIRFRSKFSSDYSAKIPAAPTGRSASNDIARRQGDYGCRDRKGTLMHFSRN